MAANSLQSVDLNNYAKMAQRMFPTSVGLAICDCTGEALGVSDDLVVQRTIRLAERHPNWYETISDAARFEVESCGSVLIMNLETGSEPTAGFLLWWIADMPQPGQAADLHDTLLCSASVFATSSSCRPSWTAWRWSYRSAMRS